MEITPDFVIPIYLDQRVVFDSLAILEKGFSALTTERVSAGSEKGSETELSGGLGVSNVFGLLQVGFGGGRTKTNRSIEDRVEEQQRVHTPTSLFARFRQHLHESALVKSCGSEDDLATLHPGDFVEAAAFLRTNPLLAAVDTVRGLMELGAAFEEPGKRPKGIQGKQGPRPQGPQRQEPDTQQMLRQWDSVRSALVQAGSMEIVGRLAAAPAVQVVLSARTEYFIDSDPSPIVDGQFRVLGKVVRAMADAGDEPINLLRNTSFAGVGQTLLGELLSAIEKASESGISLPEVVTSVPAPAILVFPIAVFL